MALSGFNPVIPIHPVNLMGDETMTARHSFILRVCGKIKQNHHPSVDSRLVES